MDQGPEHPRHEPLETPPEDLGNGVVAADHGEHARIAIPERRYFVALQVGADRVGQVPALLHRHRRHLREQRPVVAARPGEVAGHEHLGVVGHLQRRTDRHPASAVGRESPPCHHGVAAGPRRPHDGVGLDRGAVGQIHPIGANAGDQRPARRTSTRRRRRRASA